MIHTNRLALLGLAFATSFFCCIAYCLPADAAVEVSNRNLRQGDTFEVVSTTPGTAAPPTDGETSSASPGGSDQTVTFNGNKYKFFPAISNSSNTSADDVSGQKSWQLKALLAVPADLEPGKYTLKAGDESIVLSVRAGLFPLQHIRLAPSKDNFDTSKGEEEAVDNAKASLTSTRMWDGPFKAPSKARTSTGFGLKRMVNGRLLKDYFHSGLDFAGGLGSPITACAGGKVVLVGRGFKLHGNTVAVDHGQGVVSFYIHMQTIKVKEGESVKQGQQIGTIGQTGRATGPHLHFSIYVNKVAANPSNWFNSSF